MKTLAMAISVACWLGGCGNAGEGADGDSGEPQVCLLDSDCDAGHACERDSCSDQCDDGLCREQLGARAECRGGKYGRCEEIDECGRTVPCEDSTNICDRTSYHCFPEDGTCATVDDCPLFFDGAEDLGLSCEARFCRFLPSSSSVLIDAPGGIAVSSPKPGDTLDSSLDLEVRFSGPSGVYLAVVTTEEPRVVRELDDSMVWYGIADTQTTLLFAEGTMPDGSAELPRDVPMFLVVLRYMRGRLVGSSHVIPFTVGAGWLGPGADCETAGEVSGACWNATYVGGCSYARTCEIVCASNRDCSATLSTGFCDRPDKTGIRFCLRER